jgi:hypothetical protein
MDEVFCASHSDLPPCELCSAPVATEQPYCVRCAASAVISQQQVRRVVPRVRTGLLAMGLSLTTPVRVRLVSEREMEALSGEPSGTVAGLTVSHGLTVVLLSIVAGLPEVRFGSVVAHECMHAWMSQHGYPDLPQPIAEGLCQLAAFGWLRRQTEPRARLIEEVIENDPGPVYGDGFRQVRAAVRRHGLRRVLACVHATGTLPDPDARRAALRPVRKASTT